MIMERFDHNIIVRYLQREATEEEIRRLEAWILEAEENREYFFRISDLYHAGEVLLPPYQTRRDVSVAGIAAKEDIRQGESFRLFREIMKIAAIMLVTFGLSWAVFGLYQKKDTGGTAEVISTPAGSVATVILPDSTKVWLNAESSLTYYPGKFGKHSRDVFLTGEAYFDVTKKEKQRFVVNTSKIRVTVYGTRFNIKAYPEDATIETTLEEGKIELKKIVADGSGKRSLPVILKPEQRAVLVKNGGRLLLSDVITTEPGDEESNKVISVKSGRILVADKVDTEVYTSWKDGRLIIRGEPLEHLAKKLERRYDVQIVFRDNDSRSLRFTGILENETLEQVLFAVRLTSPIRYTIEHKTVYLEKIK